MAPPDVHTEQDGIPVWGYLAEPTGGAAEGRAGLIVIQEWWGLTPDIKEVADRFAAEGYVALAPTSTTARSPTSQTRRASAR